MEPWLSYGAAMAERLAGLPPKYRRRVLLEHLRRTWDEPPRSAGQDERAAKRDKPGTVWGVRSSEPVRRA